MRIALLEISNTVTKCALSSAGGLGPVGSRATAELGGGALRDWLQPWAAEAEGWLCSSVVPTLREEAIALELPGFQLLHAGLELGFGFDYPEPTEIGADRLANTAGLAAFYGAPSLAIDMGTAATFEVLGESGRFIGGCIAPGPALMLRALHHGTAQLPDGGEGDWQLPARSTLEAMRAGTQGGYPAMLAALLDQTLTTLGWKADRVPLVVTGGQAGLLMRHGSHPFVHDPHLTLQGMRRVAELNPASFVPA